MARIGDTCVSIGNEDWFIGDAESYDPVTDIAGDELLSLVNGSVRISGEQSFTLDPAGDVLYYEWTIEAPDNADTSHLGQGIDSPTLNLDTDEVGLYTVTLRVVGANGGCGPVDSVIVLSVPGRGIHYGSTSLDTAWLWQLLPTTWSKVDRSTRLKIELFWRGILQMASSDLTRMYATDRNKSIQIASERRPARWVPIELHIPIGDAALYPTYSESLTVTNGVLSGQSTPSSATIDLYLQDTRIVVPRTSGFTALESDQGRVLTLTLPDNTTHVTFVSGTLRLSSGDLAYLLPLSASLAISRFVGATASTCTLGPRQATIRRVVRTEQSALLFDGTSLKHGPSLTAEGTSCPYFEVQDAFVSGVRKGDLIHISVANELNRAEVEVVLDVVAVIPGENGFDLVAFLPANQTFSALADDVLNVLLSGNDALAREVKNTVGKSYWLRLLGVSASSGLSLSLYTQEGRVELRAYPSKITRRSRVAIDSHISGAVILKETIELQAVIEDSIVIREGGSADDLGRPPLSLIENRDFNISKGGVTLTAIGYHIGDTYLSVAVGDMGQEVGPGDRLTILDGFGRGVYRVLKAWADKIFVTPLPKFPFSNATGHVVTRTGEGYLKFFAGAVPDINPPTTLWAETLRVEDYEELESSYGEVVGISYRVWESLGAQTSYMDVIRAVHYARMSGSTIATLQTAVAALLGIAYIPTRSIVRRIDRAYRSDSSATYDKVYTEHVDEQDNPLEIFDVFFVRSQSLSSLPEKIGIHDAVIVGAVLPAGSIVGKGVEILDAVARRLPRPQDRHTFDVRISAGASPLTLNGLNLTRDTLDRIKPAYTDFTLTPVLSVGDDIDIISAILFKFRWRLFDTPYGFHGPAEMVDDQLASLNVIDGVPFTVLSTWYPDDGVFEEVDGTYKLTSASGGLQTPPADRPFTARVLRDNEIVFRTFPRATRYDQGEWIRSGDYVSYPKSPNRPFVRILDVVSDTELRLDTSSRDLLVSERCPFLILRPVRDVLLEDTLEEDATEIGVNIISLGARISNVGKGDVVSFRDTGDAARPIYALRGSLAYLQREGYPPLSQEARSQGARIRVRRPSLEPHAKGAVNLIAIDMLEGTLVSSWVGKNAYTVDENVDYLGIRIGDHVGDAGARVLAILPGRNCVVLSSAITNGTHTLTQPLGLRGDDALDLVSGGIRSGVDIRLVKQHNTYVRVRNDRDHALEFVEELPLELGDLVELVYVGSGIISFRVCALVDTFVYTNLPAEVSVGRQPNSIIITRQSPLRPIGWR